MSRLRYTILVLLVACAMVAGALPVRAQDGEGVPIFIGIVDESGEQVAIGAAPDFTVTCDKFAEALAGVDVIAAPPRLAESETHAAPGDPAAFLLIPDVPPLGDTWLFRTADAQAACPDVALPTAPAVPLAPDFTVTTYDFPATSPHNNQSITLSALRGRVVVLNFWASWCAPCRDEAPFLQAIWEDYQARDVFVLGIDYVDTPQDARDFVDAYSMTYPVAPDTATRVSEAYRITGVPETFVIDARGVVANHFPGPLTERQLREAIDAALAAPAEPPAPTTTVALTQAFASTDERLVFLYPAGWTVEEEVGFGIMIASNAETLDAPTIPVGEGAMVLIAPDALDTLPGMEGVTEYTPAAVAQALKVSFTAGAEDMTAGDVVTFELGGKPAARVAIETTMGDYPEAGLILVFEVGDGTLLAGIAIAATESMPEIEPVFLAIAESARYQ